MLVPKRLIIIGLITLLEILVLVGTATSDGGSPDYEAYVVQQSDTLATVAGQYGLPADFLARCNNLKVTDALTPGQVLVVPLMTTQLPPQLAATATPGTVTTPTGNQVEGIIGVISADKSQIWSKPGGGILLFRQAAKGTRLLITGQSGIYFAVLMSDGTTGYITKQGVTVTEERMVVAKPSPPAATVAQGGRQEIVDAAFTYLGVPYKYGGSLPDNVDCSLLVQTVFRKYGNSLPRTAAEQYRVGQPVDVWQLQPGDRLYFYDSSGDIGHTGIYIGGGRFIHASSNRGRVAVDELANKTYWRKFAGARR